MMISVHQPQYMPWLGYFEKMDRADVFVLLDNVQFKKNEWQNRNRIKSSQGAQWLTVPVRYKFPQLIREVEINNQERWQHKQRQALLSNYRKAPFWSLLEPFWEEVFSRSWSMLSDLNVFVVRELARLLGIATPLHVASTLGDFPENPDERLIALTKHFGADAYLAGSGGHDYMNLECYEQQGVKVLFQSYSHPDYHQLFGPFMPYLSVVDLIYNHGAESLAILRGTL